MKSKLQNFSKYNSKTSSKKKYSYKKILKEDTNSFGPSTQSTATEFAGNYNFAHASGNVRGARSTFQFSNANDDNEAAGSTSKTERV
jgi:hypothetical protein